MLGIVHTSREPAGNIRQMGVVPKVNILAVEDDPVMRELLRLHLADAGYVVTLAEDAIAAGHRMLKFPPDLVILDIGLPYLSGLDFAAALLADATVARVPIIFISADESFAARAERLGADFVVKPIRKERLLASVAKALSSGSEEAAASEARIGTMSAGGRKVGGGHG
jgi:DNA-binding response OmpR family regulator